MARSENDKAVEKYVFDMMSKRVKTARERALFDLYYGPSGEGGGYVKNHQIVEDWWRENGPFDLVVDDAGNVSDKHDFDKWIRSIAKERYDQAMAEAEDDPAACGIDVEDDAYEVERQIEQYAEKQAQIEADMNQENAMHYEDRDVRRLVLTREWT